MFTNKISCLLQFSPIFNSHFNYMSCKRHGSPPVKKKKTQQKFRITQQTNQPRVFVFVSLRIKTNNFDFCKEHLLLNSTHSSYITSYPTQSSLEPLLLQCRPPVMALHNRLQSHCHLNRCRCNCTSLHDQYRCYVKHMQQEQFY